MRFGVILKNVNHVDRLREFTTAAEECGFDHVLISDHLYLPSRPDYLDAWTALSYLAGATQTIRLGTCVTPITLRPPLQFAKVVASLDNLSDGRVVVGVGAGWSREEFDMFGEWLPNKERFEKFKEALTLLKLAWTRDEVSFEGKYHQADGAVVEPKPVQQPHPELWFGGWGQEMLRLAGTEGDGWIPIGPRSGEAVETPSAYRDMASEVERGLQDSDRSKEDFVFGCRFGLMEEMSSHVQEAEEFRRAGLNHYQIGVDPRESHVEVLSSFYDEVVESLR